MLSRRQIIKSEAAMNKPRNNHGLHGPAPSIADVNEFNDASKTRRPGIAKQSFGRGSYPDPRRVEMLEENLELYHRSASFWPVARLAQW
jgi:hypothetical protein